MYLIKNLKKKMTGIRFLKKLNQYLKKPKFL